MIDYRTELDIGDPVIADVNVIDGETGSLEIPYGMRGAVEDFVVLEGLGVFVVVEFDNGKRADFHLPTHEIRKKVVQ